MKKYAVVSPTEAAQTPYPYVWMNEDGSARELHGNERRDLETEFDPTDGARPNTKRAWDARNGWGKREGYLRRTLLPDPTVIGNAPTTDPHPPVTRENFAEFLRAQDPSAEIITRPDGTLVIEGKGRHRIPGFLARIVQWLRDGAQ